MLSSLIDIIYPKACTSCDTILNTGEQQICLSCQAGLPIVQWDTPKGYYDLLQRFWGRIPIEYAIPFLHMSRRGIVQKMVHSIKYGDNRTLAELLGNWFAYQMIEKNIIDFDILVPVPLHIKKLKTRGYNQSECYAKGISHVLGIECKTDVIQRKTFTSTQTRKTKFDRWVNVETVFDLNQNINLEGKHVLLIDDVITTSATLEACAHEVLKAKPSFLSVACLAIAGK